MSWNIRPPKLNECRECGTKIKSRKIGKRFCSPECHRKHCDDGAKFGRLSMATHWVGCLLGLHDWFDAAKRDYRCLYCPARTSGLGKIWAGKSLER